MPKTLRHRLAEGDLDALDDPCLPLELIADPGPWWDEGLAACAGRICVELGVKLHGRGIQVRTELKAVVLSWEEFLWADERYPNDARTISQALECLHKPLPAANLRATLELVMRVPSLLPAAEQRRALINLARRLHELVPLVGQAQVEALTKLERFLMHAG